MAKRAAKRKLSTEVASRSSTSQRSRGQKYDDGWAPPPPPSPPKPDELFTEGRVFETDRGELVGSLRLGADDLKGWRFLMGARLYTDWFLASDFYAGTLYSVGKDGTVYDLRKQEPGPFTISQLHLRDEWLTMCGNCGVHAFTGPIRHLSACKRPSAKSMAPRKLKPKRPLRVPQVP